jgi:hypothetical protein
MTTANRPNRKASDEDLIKLNSVGLSLATVGEILKCHPSTVTLRLKDLGVEPADTRRAFMEDIYFSLSLAQQEWLADQLGPNLSIKDFVKHLLVQAFVTSKGGASVNAA